MIPFLVILEPFYVSKLEQFIGLNRLFPFLKGRLTKIFVDFPEKSFE